MKSPVRPFSLILPPSISTPHANINIDTGVVVIIGPNGAGKSRLGAWLEMQSDINQICHRISAQKSLSIPNSIRTADTESAQTTLLYGHPDAKKVNHDRHHIKITHRWKENPSTSPLDDYETLLVYLFSQENFINSWYREQSLKTPTRIEPPETKLDIIKRIWESILPHRKLVIRENKIQVMLNIEPPSIYAASRMSDGERVVFYLIGQCLAAPDNGVIVIDEPENHLHKSIQAKLWDAIEAERPDCQFIYLTHDLDFAATRIAATKVCLRSFHGKAWDWYLIPDNSEMPEEIFLEIAGSRKPAIFIEGDKGSLDYFLYSKLYPDFTAIPCGGCESVIHATRSFSSLENFHRLSSHGIIDRDFRDSDEIIYLQNIGVLVLNFSELENIFFTEEVLGAIAAELRLQNFSELFESVKSIVFEELEKNKERIASSITASKIERRLKTLNAKTIGEDNLKKSLDDLMKSIEVRAIYRSTISMIDAILNNKSYAEAIKVYSNKGLIHRIGSLFGFKSHEFFDFTKRLLSSKDGESLISIMRAQLPDITLNTPGASVRE